MNQWIKWPMDEWIKRMIERRMKGPIFLSNSQDPRKLQWLVNEKLNLKI